MRSLTIGILTLCAGALVAAAPGRAQICNVAEREFVADQIVKLFNDLSVEHALICRAPAGRDSCEIACTSPQKISADLRNRNVLPLLTAVAGIAMNASGKTAFSVISFRDSLLAAQGSAMRMSAARALELYASLDSGKLDAENFRIYVAREFAVTPGASEARTAAAPEKQPATSAAVPAQPAEPDTLTVASISGTTAAASEPAAAAPALLSSQVTGRVPVPRARPRAAPRRPPAPVQAANRDDANPQSAATPAAAASPALAEVPLPRRRPRIPVPRPKVSTANQTAFSAAPAADRHSRE